MVITGFWGGEEDSRSNIKGKDVVADFKQPLVE